MTKLSGVGNPVNGVISRPNTFIGREPELARLKAALKRAGGGVVFIAGEPGVGKTRLVQELVDHARADGWQTLAGRSYEMLSMPPYFPFAEALRDYVRNCPIKRLRRELGENAAEVAVLMREVRSRLPGLSAGETLSPELERYRLFEGVSEFLLNIARDSPAGLVLTLDDLHWADEPTLLLFQYLARKIAATPFLLIGVYRAEEVDLAHPLTHLLAELSRERLADQIDLSSLSLQHSAALVRAMMDIVPAGQVMDAIYQETGGNPFFLGEVVRHLASEGRDLSNAAEAGRDWTIPHSVKQVVGQRLSRLTPDANKILEAACVLGEGFTEDLLHRVSRIDPGTVSDALVQTMRRGIIRQGKDGYEFSHPLLRRIVYDLLSSHRRQRLHLEAAAAIESTHARQLAPYVAALAAHYCLAGTAADPKKAIEYSVRAGEAARSVLAFEEAIIHYQHAIALLENQPTLEAAEEARYCRLLLALGDIHAMLGKPAEAMASYGRAAEVARQDGSPEHLARAALGFAGRPWGPTAPAGSVGLLEEALSGLGRDHADLRIYLTCRLAELLWVTGQEQRGQLLAEEALALARQSLGGTALARVVQAYFWVTRYPAEAEKMLSLCDDALTAGGSDIDWELKNRVELVRAVSLLTLGDVDRTNAQLDEMEAMHRKARIPLLEWDVLCMRGGMAAMEGQFDEADSIALRAREAARRISPEGDMAYYIPLAAAARVNEKRAGEIEHYLLDLCRRMPTQTFRAGLVCLYLRLGRGEELRRNFDCLAAHDFSDVREGGGEEPFILAVAAEACAALGDSRRACVLYQKMISMVGFNLITAPACALGAGDRYLGLLATTMRDWEKAFLHFEAALEMHRLLGAKPFLVLTQRDYARSLLARGDRNDHPKVAALLTEARAGAVALGMGRIERECAALLLIANGKEAAIAYPDGLTRREVEVLRRLAGGEFDRQIAQALTLSIHTIERHVANIYTKTGLRNRAQATRYALEHGLVASTQIST